MKIFDHLKIRSKDNSEIYEFKRLVSVFSKDCPSVIEDEPILVDQIELNSRLNMVKVQDELRDISANYILMSYACLYSLISPILCLLVFIGNVFSMKFERAIHIRFTKRERMMEQNGLGAFLEVMEYLGIATVLINCVFMYWFRI